MTVEVAVDPDELALLQCLTNGDVIAGLITMGRPIEQLPADVRARLEAHAEDDAER